MMTGPTRPATCASVQVFGGPAASSTSLGHHLEPNATTSTSACGYEALEFRK